MPGATGSAQLFAEPRRPVGSGADDAHEVLNYGRGGIEPGLSGNVSREMVKQWYLAQPRRHRLIGKRSIPQTRMMRTDVADVVGTAGSARSSVR
jgi:hypothetical protein